MFSFPRRAPTPHGHADNEKNPRIFFAPARIVHRDDARKTTKAHGVSTPWAFVTRSQSGGLRRHLLRLLTRRELAAVIEDGSVKARRSDIETRRGD